MRALAVWLVSVTVLCAGKVILKRSVEKQGWEHLARVIGGTNAKNNQYPFTAFIMIDEGDSVAYCGGTIISRQWILTAGHCAVDTSRGNSLVTPLHNATTRVGSIGGRQSRDSRALKGSGSPRGFKAVDPRQISVGVGSVYTEQASHQKVSQVHVHPDLNLDYFDNDIALIKLKHKLRFNSDVQPILIDTGTIIDGLTVTGVGWGITSLHSHATAEVLQQVDMHTGDNSLCHRIRSQFTGNDGNYICVTTPDGRDTCSGDSGGPLLRRCNNNPQLTGSSGSGPWLQLGVTSYGDAVSISADTVCAYPDGAGFYTHVAAYFDFITKVTGISRNDLAATCNGSQLSYAGHSGAAALPSVGPHLLAAMCAGISLHLFL